MTSRWGVECVRHTASHVGNGAGAEDSAQGELRLVPRARDESRCLQCGGRLGGSSAEHPEESFLACSLALTHGCPPRPWRCGGFAGRTGIQARNLCLQVTKARLHRWQSKG